MDKAEKRAVFVGPSEGEATGFRRRLIAKLRADNFDDAIFVMESRVARSGDRHESRRDQVAAAFFFSASHSASLSYADLLNLSQTGV